MAQKIPTYLFDIRAITIPEPALAIDEARVDALVLSILRNGLKEPIAVRVVPDWVNNAGQSGRAILLESGRHRLEAFRRLSRMEITVIGLDLYALTERELDLFPSFPGSLIILDYEEFERQAEQDRAERLTYALAAYDALPVQDKADFIERRGLRATLVPPTEDKPAFHEKFLAYRESGNPFIPYSWV